MCKYKCRCTNPNLPFRMLTELFTQTFLNREKLSSPRLCRQMLTEHIISYLESLWTTTYKKRVLRNLSHLLRQAKTLKCDVQRTEKWSPFQLAYEGNTKKVTNIKGIVSLKPKSKCFTFFLALNLPSVFNHCFSCKCIS